MKKRIESKYFISDFYCTKCGNKGIPVSRVFGQLRETGHLKKLYCTYCHEETNCVEIRPYSPYTIETFKTEFKEGNFDENGNRKMTYKECLAKCAT